MQDKTLKEEIRKLALDYFHLAGFASLELTSEEKSRLIEFVKSGRNAEMDWFLGHDALRLDPLRLFPSARIALVLGSFYKEDEMIDSDYPVARSARGMDYHDVLRKQGRSLAKSLKDRWNITSRFCVDSAPLAERMLGARAGLGFIGRNTCLIHPDHGSFFFLSVFLLDIDLETDSALPGDGCGNCTACLNGCPSLALDGLTLDARKCLSYKSIEDKQLSDARPSFFGCDICQDVCPYNRKVTPAPLDDLRTDESMKSFMKNPFDFFDTDRWSAFSKGRLISRAALSKVEHNARLIRDGR
jgi:epoxyqueuosine reductase